MQTVGSGARKGLFQSFEPGPGGAHCADRVFALRAALRGLGADGMVVPRADEHQGEYVPASEARLLWLTGFSGSAGTAIVLPTEAALFVDGRYTAQARNETDLSVFSVVPSQEVSIEAWLEDRLTDGAILTFDARLFTPDAVERLRKAVAKRGAVLKPLEFNPIDDAWKDRPPATANAVTAHPLAFAGETSAAKIERLREAVARNRLDAQFLSDPHDVAWLFNLRGSDIAHTPIARIYALVPRDGRAVVFVDASRLEPEAREGLSGIAECVSPSDVSARIAAFSSGRRRIGCDEATVASAWVAAIEAAQGKAVIAPSPVARMKAIKNSVEIAGHRAAQTRDGAAVTRFLAWFAREAPKGKLTEIDAAIALEQFRKDTNALVGLSFPSISAAGLNAALPHYRVTEATNRRIEAGIFLIDSGGQYRDGTTDITRTIAVGRPSSRMIDRNTRVLKGHIAIATSVFPVGTTGAQLDSFARRSLWEAGEDFDHGTGHGIGAFLSVHEGPQSISKRGAATLEAGMIISNEPGYYEEGAFGIRIENLVLVEPRNIPGGSRRMLGFETLTFAPIDRTLIDPALLTVGEIAWLDAYHAKVREKLAPALTGTDLAFLEEATSEIVPN